MSGNRVFVLKRQPSNAVQTVQRSGGGVVDFKAVGFITFTTCASDHFKFNARIGFHQGKQLIVLCVAPGLPAAVGC